MEELVADAGAGDVAGEDADSAFGLVVGDAEVSAAELLILELAGGLKDGAGAGFEQLLLVPGLEEQFGAGLGERRQGRGEQDEERQERMTKRGGHDDGDSFRL